MGSIWSILSICSCWKVLVYSKATLALNESARRCVIETKPWVFTVWSEVARLDSAGRLSIKLIMKKLTDLRVK